MKLGSRENLPRIVRVSPMYFATVDCNQAEAVNMADKLVEQFGRNATWRKRLYLLLLAIQWRRKITSVQGE